MKIMEKAIDGYKNVVSEKYLGIFGHPIGHTLSPVIHNTLSRELNLPESYIPFHIDIKDDLRMWTSTAFSEGILG